MVFKYFLGLFFIASPLVVFAQLAPASDKAIAEYNAKIGSQWSEWVRPDDPKKYDVQVNWGIYEPRPLPAMNAVEAPNNPRYRGDAMVPPLYLTLYSYPEYWRGEPTGKMLLAYAVPPPPPIKSQNFIYSWGISKIEKNKATGGFIYHLQIVRKEKPKPPAPPRKIWGLNLSNGRFEEMDAPPEPKPKPRTDLIEPILTFPR